MAVDLSSSRRDTPERARWWKAINKKKVNEIIATEVPNGIFYFKQVNVENNTKEITGGGFQYDSSDFVILTHDVVKALKPNDIVKLRGETYIVVDVQRKPRNKNFLYGTIASYDTYINLRSV